MVECRCPFSILSQWQADIEVPPVADGADNGGYYDMMMTFPQAMDQTSTPALTDFDSTGFITDGDFQSIAWISATVLRLRTDATYPGMSESYLDYTKGSNPIRTAELQEYASWEDLEFPAF